MANSMDMLHGITLGLGLQQLPKVLEALHKAKGLGNETPAADGGQASGIPGLEGMDPEALMAILAPLLQGQGAAPPTPQAGPVPGVPAPRPMMPPGMAGAMPPPTMPMSPPPSMGRMPVVPRVLSMDQGGQS